MRATQSSAASFTQARLFTNFFAIFYDGISLQVLTFCFRKSPSLLVVLKKLHEFCKKILGHTTLRVRHSHGPPLSGAATCRAPTPRVSRYIQYLNISSIELLFQQIIILTVSNSYLH